MLTPEQYAIMNKLSTGGMVRESVLVETNTSSPIEIKGVWPHTMKELSIAWIKNEEQLKAISEEEIRKTVTNPISLKAILSFISWK